ncbi:MAG: hypothetical protein J3K34DRAFT_288445 [Monoraphidium minutum]|nr:MAG: hypothetical protein J3K34DRAFT_288445 [Monoraphidium minutum]
MHTSCHPSSSQSHSHQASPSKPDYSKATAGGARAWALACNDTPNRRAAPIGPPSRRAREERAGSVRVDGQPRQPWVGWWSMHLHPRSDGGTPTRELGRPQFWDAPRMGGGGAQHDPTWMLFVGGVAAPGADFDIQCFIVKVLTRCRGSQPKRAPTSGSLGGPRIDKGIDGRPVGVAGRGRSAAGGRLKAQPGRRVPLIGTCLCACARMCVWGE